ncbi:unnamed protein product [Adineta steineri]|uniref:Uncharacterized protein n=1 Tax=Adineta steineri TaxID=433720 RepID=A0A815LF60_9BILA|nr:unnamed protein product [Adineta steineri]CAF1403415.1 unnamed protein product [Adineta steineri]
MNHLIGPDTDLNTVKGPFDFCPVNIEIRLFQDGQRSSYVITSINGQSLGTEHLQGIRSPIVRINFPDGAIRHAAKIPDNATHFCWLNSVDIAQSDIAKNASKNEMAMLLHGGLAYFNQDGSHTYNLIQINRFRLIETGCLWLKGPKPWRSEYTQSLRSEGRLASVQHTHLWDKGVRYVAFLNSSEEFMNANDTNPPYIATEYWAFLYLFNDDTTPNERDCFYEVSPVPFGEQPTE